MAIGKLRDFTKENSQKEIIEALGRQETFDIVLSEMASNASGIKSLDQDRIIDLAMKIKDLMLYLGCLGTCLVIKSLADRQCFDNIY